MKNKKSQMKIQQMAFMLIAVMMFFALVGLLIVTVKFSGLRETATNLEEKNAMLLVTKLANSPEFSCGNSFGKPRTSCIDADKIMALKNNMDKYETFWGVSGIEIRKLYPVIPGNVECTSQNYQTCNKITLLPVQGISIDNFVSLCRKEFDGEKTYDKCILAQISMFYEKVQ